MKASTRLFALTLLGVAALAGAQVNLPDPSQPGNSMDSAVRIVAPSELMIDRFIDRWIRAHYPGWDADPYEIQEVGPERYAVVYIRSANNGGRRVYFKINKSMRDENDERSPFPPL